MRRRVLGSLGAWVRWLLGASERGALALGGCWAWERRVPTQGWGCRSRTKTAGFSLRATRARGNPAPPASRKGGHWSSSWGAPRLFAFNGRAGGAAA